MSIRDFLAKVSILLSDNENDRVFFKEYQKQKNTGKMLKEDKLEKSKKVCSMEPMQPMSSMKNHASALVFTLLGLFSANLVHALGLGEITLKSSLNEPLVAEIRLLEVRDLAKSQIKVKLAPRDAFQRAGVERAFFLNDITFEVDLSDRSMPLIRLQSTKTVVEPYLNFLLEVQWPSGRLLREYTLLMDLPIFDSASSSSKVTTPAAKTNIPSVKSKQQATKPTPIKAEKSSVSPSFSTRSAPANSAPSATAESSATQESMPTEYQIVEGDTLWDIALRTRPDQSVIVHQSMLAIQRKNPEAFIDGNINLLRKGEVLRLPNKAEMLSVSTQQAIAEVARQNRQWSSQTNTGAVLKGDSAASPLNDSQSSAPTGRLKLSAIDNLPTSTAEISGGGGTGNSLENQLVAAQEELDRTNQENKELSERVEQLEAQIDTMEKLIAVSNDKLRALQLAAAEKNTSDTTGEIIEDAELKLQSRGTGDSLTQVERPMVPEEKMTEVSEPDTDSQQPETSALSQTNTSSASAAPETITQTEAPIASEPVTETERNIVDAIKDNINYIAGAVIALLFFVMLLLRFRKKDSEDELDIIDEIGSVDEENNQQEDIITEQFDEDADSLIVDDELNLDGDQFEESIDDDVDAIDKANIFISLGQYEQAEKLLLREIETNPDNVNARLNLLKVYSETKNVGEFDVQYAQLLPMGNASINEKAKALRDAIPNAGDFDVSQYVSEDADQFSFGDQPDLDKDLQSLTETANIDDGKDDTSLDLDFSDFDKELTEDQSLSEENKQTEYTADEEAPSITTEDGLLTDDKQDTFDDMSLDFDDDLSIEDNQDDSDLLTPEKDNLSEPESIDFSTEFDPESESVDIGSDTQIPTGQSSDGEDSDMQLSSDQVDMASLDKEISSIIDDQPEAEAPGQPDDQLDFDSNLNDLDNDLNTLSDDSDEVETKLELALAYLDMGDSGGAKDILSEVIEEGTPEQQNKARDLLNKL